RAQALYTDDEAGAPVDHPPDHVDRLDLVRVEIGDGFALVVELQQRRIIVAHAQAPTRWRTSLMSRTGRISIAPVRAHGKLEAMSTASSMSAASIRLKPPRYSLVSAYGPSTTLVRPSRTRTVRAVAGPSSCCESCSFPFARSASALTKQPCIRVSNSPSGSASSKVSSQ